MRYMLQDSSGGTSSAGIGTDSAVQVKTSHAGPTFTLALLVLVGLCALFGVAWIFLKLFRIFKPQRPQLRLTPATFSGGLSAHGLQHRSSAYLSGPFVSDLERGDTADSLTFVERTDSMVMRASVWAQAILSGEHPLPPTLPTPPPVSSSNHCGTTKPWDTISIPVKQAVVITQPDGQATLGISEVKQKDVMVQVDEEDLIRESNNCGGGFRGRNTSSSMSGFVCPSSGAATAHQRRQQRLDVVDEASQCPGQSSRDNSRSQLGRASATVEDSSYVRSSSSTITGKGQVGIGDDMLHMGVSVSPEIEDSSSSVPAEQQDQHGRQRRRRRRKRRKGTCEASCQTEESSLS
ncbi:hypothetical protein Ndes2526B_g06347 [Nannochloris sp. 'desiccata']|nr:hypothetical protein KSW81_008113 [Chlorella desiccata (nom. nud.)]KAH7619374.1 hypothetical protein NADE_006217 [Chlorella desiccata (nom. nud.)]